MPAPPDLNEVLVFARVVESGSFTGAARALHMPKSTVSRKVTDLEERLGARLLQRTTRRLSLTDEGRTYYSYSARIATEIEEAERAVGRLHELPRGPLRVTMPLNFDFMGPTIAEFAKRYPEVTLDVVSTDRVVGLVEEGFDVAIRAGRLADSTLVARALVTIRRIVVASPGYLKKHGRPRAPGDLEQHDCLVFSGGADRSWQLHRESSTLEVAVRPRLVINDFEILLAAATAGLGVAMLPEYRCIADLRARRLEHVLKEWCSPRAAIHAVYPSTRHLSPKVKAFVDHLQEKLATPPWERP